MLAIDSPVCDADRMIAANAAIPQINKAGTRSTAAGRSSNTNHAAMGSTTGARSSAVRSASRACSVFMTHEKANLRPMHAYDDHCAQVHHLAVPGTWTIKERRSQISRGEGLCAAGFPVPTGHETPPRYGLRDKTVLDERVRAGWEIGARQLKIDARRWQRTLRSQFAQIGRDLGLSEGCTLRAELYNLLVYGPGQFFAPHQDSEKADGMVGTLVVMLPSEFKGGAFVIEHHGETVSYRGSRDRLSFVAFYADCHHKVRAVTDGYRIVLTDNLFHVHQIVQSHEFPVTHQTRRTGRPARLCWPRPARCSRARRPRARPARVTSRG